MFFFPKFVSFRIRNSFAFFRIFERNVAKSGFAASKSFICKLRVRFFHSIFLFYLFFFDGGTQRTVIFASQSRHFRVFPSRLKAGKFKSKVHGLATCVAVSKVFPVLR